MTHLDAPVGVLKDVSLYEPSVEAAKQASVAPPLYCSNPT